VTVSFIRFGSRLLFGRVMVAICRAAEITMLRLVYLGAAAANRKVQHGDA